jgi:hypothetical protein
MRDTMEIQTAIVILNSSIGLVQKSALADQKFWRMVLARICPTFLTLVELPDSFDRAIR